MHPFNVFRRIEFEIEINLKIRILFFLLDDDNLVVALFWVCSFGRSVFASPNRGNKKCFISDFKLEYILAFSNNYKITN